MNYTEEDNRTTELETMCLEHIVICLRYRPPMDALRTYIDDWFAYKSGGPFLGRTMRPKWFNNPKSKNQFAAMRQMHFVSDNARKVLEGEIEARIVKDHAVPVKVIREKLHTLENPSIHSVGRLLLDHYKLGVITKEEDRLLSGELRAAMPDDWDGIDMFARYSKVGILGTKQY